MSKLLLSVVHRPRTLERIRANAFGFIMNRLCGYLVHRGYTLGVMQRYLQCVEHLGNWLRFQGLPATCLDERRIAAFLNHLPHCGCPTPAPRDARSGAIISRQLLRLLRSQGIVPPPKSAAIVPVNQEVEGFDRHLSETCGLAPSTRTGRCKHVHEFLLHLFGRGPVSLNRIKPRAVREFVLNRAAELKPGTAKVIVCALRSYFKYLRLLGLGDARLLSATPAVRLRKLTSIPKTIKPEDLRRFLSSFDLGTATGRRDYAMALCLADCGLRTSEVAGLSLDDVDWRQGTVNVTSSKTNRSRLLPLTPRVARAIAAYLRSGRPPSVSRGLFLRHIAPKGEVTTHIVRGVMRRTHARSGAAPWNGLHSLRHTLAANMLKGGARIKEIADVLGHSTINTTTIYAKVDLPTLSKVAMPWPRGARS